MADTAFDIKSDSPVNDDLMFWSIVGHESLSRPSFYELTVLSRNRLIDPKDILGKPFNVGAYFKDAQNGSHERHFQGHAVRMVRGGQLGRYFQYHISLRSWVWLLSRRTNSRIFQDKSILEVIDAVMEDSPIKGFKKTKIDNVIGSHQPRRYCVQHAESDYNFVNRLLEDEGVYYWFDSHDKTGTMYMADSSDVAHTDLPANGTLRFTQDGPEHGRHNEITRWVSANRLETGMYASTDYDHKATSKKLNVAAGWPDDNDLANFELFESPGGYFTLEEGQARSVLRSDEMLAKTQRNWALTAWPDVAVGHRFKYEGSPEGASDGDYLIAGCTFVMSHAGYEGVAPTAGGPSILSMLREALESDAANADTRNAYEGMIESTPSFRTGVRGSSSFLITALPLGRLFRPDRVTPRTMMSGPQSAVVVGAAGKEIDVDEFGRVKVQFHWDRYGENNEKSTCWLRVSQPMAGKGWGGYFAPRIGQEVIVDFLNGDPDRPLVVGRLYNDDQPIPYQSPTESGFRTHSTPGGTAKQFNELRFDDKAGAEQLHMRAQHRMDVCVEQNYYEHIKGASSSAVGGTQFVTVGHKQHLVVKDKQYVKVNDDAHWLYMGDVNFGISKSLKLAASSAVALTGGTVLIEASQKLELSCGGSLIRISASGVEIEGPMVKINCSAPPVQGSSPNVIEAKEAGGSKCAQANDKPSNPKPPAPHVKPPGPQPKPQPVLPQPVQPKPEPVPVPQPVIPPQPGVIPPVPVLPNPASELCVSLHEIVEFGDSALAEIDALIEELDDATSDVLGQAENLSQDAIQRCADKVTAAQATMHDAKKEIANAQKAACDQLSTAGAQAQKLTQNVSNGVNKAMAKANSAVADPTVQDIMGKAGVANDVNRVAGDVNKLATDAQNTIERARADALAASTDAVNQAGNAVDGVAQDVMNEADTAANQATAAAGDAHRAISKASDEARKALLAAKAAAQAAIAAARAAMAMADVDVCVPIPGLAAMMAAARAEMERLAAMARALVQQGKDAATKGLDAAKKGLDDAEKAVDDAEKAVDDAEKAAKDAADQAIDEAERVANEVKQRAEQLAKDAEAAGQKVLDAANQRVADIQKRVEDAAKVAKQQAEDLMKQGQQTVENTVNTIKDEVARAQAEAMKALEDLIP